MNMNRYENERDPRSKKDYAKKGKPRHANLRRQQLIEDERIKTRKRV